MNSTFIEFVFLSLMNVPRPEYGHFRPISVTLCRRTSRRTPLLEENMLEEVLIFKDSKKPSRHLSNFQLIKATKFWNQLVILAVRRGSRSWYSQNVEICISKCFFTQKESLKRMFEPNHLANRPVHSGSEWFTLQVSSKCWKMFIKMLLY